MEVEMLGFHQDCIKVESNLDFKNRLIYRILIPSDTLNRIPNLTRKSIYVYLDKFCHP